MALAAAVLIRPLEEPLEFVAAPALLWIERAYEDEEQGRALNFVAQGFGQWVTGLQDAIIEEDFQPRGRVSIQGGGEAVVQPLGNMAAPQAHVGGIGLKLGMGVADEDVVLEWLPNVRQRSLL